jgi:amino acid adenylation domain-containing protein
VSRPGAMEGGESLTEVLSRRGAEIPGRVAYTFLEEGEREGRSLTWGELDRLVSGVAADLEAEGLAGERALLLFPPGLDFVVAFLGCLRAGTVAVPAYPPTSRRTLPRLASLLADARPAAVLTDAASLEKLRGPGRGVPGLDDLAWVVADRCAPVDAWHGPAAGPDDLAFLQYTSGSTAEPKGVMVTHRNLAANEAMIARAFGQSEESVVVGWLPVYHDMGLIGNVLQPLYAGSRCVLMSPMAFLSRPVRWLEAITRYRGTTSGGPDFAYSLCVRKTTPEEREALDLSSWRLAFDGAEPVRADTLERFARAFEPHGFRRSAFFPCYGLAEATLFVSGGPPGGGAVTRGVSAPELERDRISPAEAGDARRLIASGPPSDELRVEVVDPATGRPSGPREVGEIWVAGPSVARGYWDRPERTRTDFRAALADGGDGESFLRTGDLGFLLDGLLYVTGRLKDLIILRGRNHYPQDIERTAEAAHSDLRPGSVAAFPTESGGEERLVVVCELSRHPKSDPGEIVGTLHQAIVEGHEVAAHEVVLVRPGGVPKTTSGKVRRRVCRDAYLADELQVVARGGSAGIGGDGRAEEGVDAPGEVSGVPEGELAEIAELAARALELPADGVRRIDPSVPLTRFGLDSLAAVELERLLHRRYGRGVGLAALLEGAALTEIARSLADAPAGPAADPGPPVAGAPFAGELPLSHGQEALWFLTRLAPESGAYNLGGAAWIAGGLDTGALARALRGLAERHEALRATFHAGPDGPRQRIAPEPSAGSAIEEIEVPAVPGESRETLVPRIEELLRRPFDLESGPPLRLALLRRPDGDALVLAVHHLVSDFWSLGLLIHDLGALYARETGADAPRLPPVAGYGALISEQRRWAESEESEDAERYWEGALEGAATVLDLPTDRSRSATPGFSGGTVSRSLAGDRTEAMRNLLRGSGASLFVGVLAGFHTLIHRLTGADRFLVGAPTATRSRPGTDGVVGYLVNPLPIRADLAGRPSFRETVARVRRALVGALEHQDYPFPRMEERFGSAAGGRSSLLRVTAVHHRAPRRELRPLAALATGRARGSFDLGGLVAEPIAVPETVSQFDLTLRSAEDGDGLSLCFQYDAELFDRSTAGRLLDTLAHLLDGAAAEPGRPVDELALLAPAQRRQLLEEWGSAPTEHSGGLLHDLFLEQARRTPDTVGFGLGPDQLTYGELARRVRHLAARLRTEGVGADRLVAVGMTSSLDRVTAIFAVLAAGGGYLPLDPEYPDARLADMIEDARPVLTIADPETAERLTGAGAPVLRLVNGRLQGAAGAPSNGTAADPDSAAYVLFTSGSTGRPKGVVVPHRAIVNHMRWMQRAYPLTPGDCVLQRTSVGFDASVWELFAPLAVGARLALLPPGLSREPERFAATALDERGTVIQLVPSLLGALVQEPRFAECRALRQVFCGGEPLPLDLARRVLGLLPATLVNLYGPTEATIECLTRAWPAGSPVDRVTLGRPIDNARLAIVDSRLEPLPAGVPGELVIGGVGVSRGYVGRPAWTAERFVPDPLSGRPGERLYRSGDRARWGATGEVESLGRIDRQVKLRGHRIEPGEIEQALAAVPGVGGAVVDVREPVAGDRRLVAWVVPEAGFEAPSPERLRTRLARTLPAFMVPGLYQVLEAFPLTPTAKVDRRALPTPEASGVGTGRAPEGPAEERIAGAFEELLPISGRVGADDSFFDLGGHSLLATRLVVRLRERFGVEVPVRTVFERPTVASLAAWLEARRGSRSAEGPEAVEAPIERLSRDRTLPASFAQSRLWFLERLDPDAAAYTMAGALHLRGALDRPALARALDRLVARHEVLRTVLEEARGEPVQRIAPPVRRPLPWIDLSGLADDVREGELERIGRGAARRRFALDRDPPLRALLVSVGTAGHSAVFVLHHVAADGWSLGVLYRDLAALYAAEIGSGDGDRAPALDELPIQYADYASWQRKRFREGVLEPQLAYWRGRLADGPPLLELPGDRTRPARPSFRGRGRPVRLPAALAAQLRTLSRREGVTLFMTLLAAFDTLLYRWTGQDDVVVGAPIANRRRRELEGLVGFFVNMLVLRTDLSGAPSFRDLLARVRETCLGAYEHQDVPFERLVEELQPDRSGSRHPLFQVTFALHDALAGPPEMPGLSVVEERLSTGQVKFDLDLGLEELPAATGDAGGLGGWLESSTDLFDASTVERFRRQLETLLGAAVADPVRPIDSLDLLAPGERHQVTTEWSDTAAPGLGNGGGAERVEDLFLRAAAARPGAPAVADPERTLDYRTLERESRALARRLRALGVVPETVVGVLCHRSTDFVVAALAVLRAGGAYLPFDPASPVERIAFMLEDSGARVLVTHRELAAPAAFTGEEVRVEASADDAGDADRPLPAVAASGSVGQADTLAYVVYTSGSTGLPKGVAVSHRALLNLVAWHRRAFDIAPSDRASQLAGQGFDAAVWEIWPYLVTGASVHVPGPETAASPEALIEWVSEQGISIGFFATPLAEAVLELGWPPDSPLRTLLTGGDTLRSRPRPWLPFTLVNDYGPTENGVVATSGRVDPPVRQGRSGESRGLPSIGRPIDNVRARVLDPRLRPSPAGVPGELCLAGGSLARGYLGRPALTAERFVPASGGAPGERLYRTGDLTRFRPGGALEFLGRIDRQVQVRGFRVELGEIEARLRERDEVAEATVVLAGPAGRERLVGYLVPAAGPVDTGALVASLAAELPEPMIPSAWVEIDAIPLTANGKVDRDALPSPPDPGGEASRRGVPRTPTEELVAGIWAEVLEVDAVGREDDFFALGGHSLLATRMVSRLRGVLGTEVPLREAFGRPTVASLAAWLDQHRKGAMPPVAPPIEPRNGGDAGLALSYGQERLWFLQQLDPDSSAYHVPAALHLRGRLDRSALERALGEVVRRHRVLRTRFPPVGERPEPRVDDPPPPEGFGLREVDLSCREDGREAWRTLAAEEARKPFRLDAEAPLRASLFHLGAEENVLLLTLHHIATDGWSMALLLRELGTLYGELSRGVAPSLDDPPVQYADYAAWQRSWLTGEVLDLELQHWRERLAGAPPLLPLPTDRRRPKVRSDRGGRVTTDLAPELAEGVRELAVAEGATPFMVFGTAFVAFLSRLSGETDVVIGTPIAGRNRAEVEDLVGFFVNTLALRLDLSDDPPFRVALARSREVTLDAFAHQEVPFERLVEELRPERNLGHTPLFQVLFTYQEVPWAAAGGPAFGGLEAEPVEVDEETAQFDLALSVLRDGDRLLCRLVYGADLFERTTAERWLDSFQRLLAGAVAEPDRPVGRLPLLAPSETERLLREWAPGPAPLAGAEPERAEERALLCSFFEARAAERPETVALVGPEGAEQLSYGELDRRSRRLAAALVAAGAGPETPVGVLLPRSPELVVSLLAVLRAGAAYVPLDPEYPEERLAFMLRDSGAPVVVARSGVPAGLEGLRTVAPDAAGDAPASAASATAADTRNLAYVIYTSGSTGRPKGVAIEHRSAAELMRWARRAFSDLELEGVLAATSVCFDLSVFEIFAPLSWGGCLVLAEDALALAGHPARGRVRLVNTVPSAMTELSRGGLPRGVRSVNLAGEPLSPALARRIHENPDVSRLTNLYGPSEDTTYSTEAPVEPDGEVSIGRPIDGGLARIHDRWGSLSPTGAYGELCLGGSGLVRGYLGRPALTAERFVPDPYAGSPGARVYRTGDLARWRPAEVPAGAVLEYAGRIDHQVKVRGFRIELEEIEHALARHPAVAEAAVAAAGEGGDRFLAGYLVPAGDGPAPAGGELRAFLRRTLPEHMVPTAWVELPSLPRTPNGKLDRRSLPRPGAGAGGRPEHVAPRSELEELLVAIWSEVLERDDVGVHDDFFDIGGQSLRATQVAAKLRSALDVEIPVRTLFEAPTVAGLAVEVVRELAAEAGDEDLEALLGEVDAWSGDADDEVALAIGAE